MHDSMIAFDRKLLKKFYMTLIGAITLLLLAVAPVYAAPSLSLGSTASYNLTAKVVATQSCTADPALYTPQACGFVSLPPPNQIFRASWVDNGVCPLNNITVCYFSPSFLGIPTGSSVQWVHSGSLPHTATSNATLNPGLPSFNSGTVFPGSTFTNNFSVPGTYHYYCAIHPWMKGVIDVSGPPPPPPPSPPPPMPQTFQADLTGTVGWTVEGLSSSQANLLVSHNIALSVSPTPVFRFTPVTESGSFEQSINLSTRVESPGTATSIVRAVLTSLLPALSGFNQQAAVSGSIFQAMLARQSDGPVFTQWWVNGPLSNGSPVQIIQGWSSVTGSEKLDLGGNIGTRSAWIVTSQISQTVNVMIPNVSNPLGPSPTSTATANLKLLWSFDKNADLLLRSNDTLSLMMHNVMPTTIYTTVPCGQLTCSNPISVTITRDMSITVNITMLLSSTSLSLHGPGSNEQTSTLMDLLTSMPWMPLGIAGLAAGAVVGSVLWLNRRARGATLAGSAPTLAQTPSSS